jgi:Ca2+-transporting ATPase
VPVEKSDETLHDEHLPVGDRRNMLYKGTLVSYGRGMGVVVGTGMETELGRIATMLQEGEEVKTPLQKRLASFGQKLAIAILAICALVFGIGVLRGEEPLLMLLTAISLAVAAIPEALPAVITITLAIGAKKLVKQNVLIRKLPAVETLGSVTYICSDKTGTLTLNKMTVEEIHAGKRTLRGDDFQPERHGEFFRALALSNDAHLDAEGGEIGDPTELAIYRMAREHGFDKRTLETEFPRVAEIPFDSDRKCMTTIHRRPDGSYVSFTKGAMDVLAERAKDTLTPEGREPFDSGEVHRANEDMAGDGLRVLGVASRTWDAVPDEVTPDVVERDLTFLGLVGLMDPPREEAVNSVSVCMKAGITPVMITGDHPATALAIAKRLGMVKDDVKSVITGRVLERLSLEEFEERVEHIRVYARVAPEQKLMIVKALQDKGQFVAMTGDGVNDAPALKSADIGVAMGITGTDVSKEASHMILRDDNFASIVDAVAEGRRIFDNIRKFIKYTMTSNSGEIWTIFLAPFFGLPVPLLPIHILWINLATDGLPGLALSAEPAERGVMQRPPRHPKESIFAHGLAAHMLWVGLLMGFVSIFTETWFFRAGNERWQTMVFTVLALSQLGHVLAIRSERQSLFSIGLFSNRHLLGAVVLTLGLQLATIYVPFLNPIFKTQPLTLSELAITLALSSVVFLAVEVEKAVKRWRGWQ